MKDINIAYKYVTFPCCESSHSKTESVNTRSGPCTMEMLSLSDYIVAHLLASCDWSILLDETAKVNVFQLQINLKKKCMFMKHLNMHRKRGSEHWSLLFCCWMFGIRYRSHNSWFYVYIERRQASIHSRSLLSAKHRFQKCTLYSTCCFWNRLLLSPGWQSYLYIYRSKCIKSVMISASTGRCWMRTCNCYYNITWRGKIILINPPWPQHLMDYRTEMFQRERGEEDGL